MPTPSDLRILASLRHRGQCPVLSVMVTDEWRWQAVLEPLGVLVIRVQAGDASADWSPLASLMVLLCQWRTRGPELAQAILAANPRCFEVLDVRPPKIRSSVVWDGSENPLTYRERERRDFLFAKAWVAA